MRRYALPVSSRRRRRHRRRMVRRAVALGIVIVALFGGLSVVFGMTNQFRGVRQGVEAGPKPVEYLGAMDKRFPFAAGPPPEIGIDNGY